MAAKEACVKQLESRYKEQVQEIKTAYTRANIIVHALEGDKATGWNNQVKQCKEVSFADKTFLLIEETRLGTFSMIEKASLADGALRYLRAFIDEESEPIIDIDQVEETPEIEKLKAHVRELKSDRVELAHELSLLRVEGDEEAARETKSLKVVEL